jgi:hypothetical protein
MPQPEAGDGVSIDRVCDGQPTLEEIAVDGIIGLAEDAPLSQ